MKSLRPADQGGALDLPVNVRVLTRLLSAFDDGAVSSRALSEFVLCDPILTLHVLVGAGPNAAADAAQTFSLDGCVAALGADMLHALVYRELGRHMRGESVPSSQTILAPLWARSILCSELASGLARTLQRPVAPARLAGLLHLSGQLVLLKAQPDAYLPLLASTAGVGELLLRAEREALHTTHDEAGAILLETCALPGFAPEAVRLQYEPPERLVDTPFEVRAVKLASALAAHGLTPEISSVAPGLLGIEAEALARVLQEALAAARANPAGIEIDDVPRPDMQRLVGGGELSLQFPARVDAPVSQSVLQTASAFAESGANWTLRQALSGAGDQQGALLRARRLTRLLTGLGPQVFFLATPDGKRLAAVLLEGDRRELGELAVTLEGSLSLLARAARDRRPALAVGSALAQGAALDRVLARLLGAGGLLCVPMMHDSTLVGVTVIALPAEQQKIVEPGPVLTRIAAAAAENVLRAGRRAGSEEQVRSELTERFRTAGKRVVHEAGNPLSIVKNYLKLLGDKLPDKAQVREELTILNEELDRVARIVQRMGDPFAIDIEEPARLDLNSLVNELMTLCRDTLFAKRGIEVVQQLDPQLPLLRADTGAVKQVALNVLTNAAEAMPNGGRLSMMTADNVNLGGNLFTLLQISDTGGGMGPDAMQRLFRAGSSTKGDGHEGIGLAVSASILQRLGGHVLCRSSIGRGTIFLILLPRRIYTPESDAVPAPKPDGDAASKFVGGATPRAGGGAAPKVAGGTAPKVGGGAAPKAGGGAAHVPDAAA